MKNFFFILCLIFLSYFNLNAECRNYCISYYFDIYPPITNFKLNDIIFGTDDVGWVIGDLGTIIKTTDGFYYTSINQESNTNVELLSISLVSNDLLWISGNNGIILKTTNGGDTWIQYNTNLTDNITSIDFANENVGWAIGSNGNILRTMDAGDNWEIFPNIEFLGLKRLCVTDQNNAWAIGNNGKILKLTYSNNSITYINKSQPGLTRNLNDVAFFDSNIGWVVGDTTTNLKTTDGGITWTYLPNNEEIWNSSKYNKINIINQSYVYIATSQGLIISSDGGFTWFTDFYNQYKPLNSVCFIDENVGYSVDSTGNIGLYLCDYCNYTYCLNSPVDGATDININIILTWELIWGYYTFYIEVATDSLFENIVSYAYDIEDYHYMPGPLEYGTTYYWRMKMDEGGIWSDVWSFTTEPANPTTINIPLINGWNLISSNVITEEPAMESVFEDMNNIVLVKNGIGQIYSPAFGINQIGNWNVEAGYYVYTNGSSLLSISGNEVNPTQQGIELNAGWILVSYLRNSPMNVQQAVASISSNLVMAKNNSGGFYHPGFGINTLGELQPGQGYWLYMNAPAILTYPEN